MRFLGWRFPFSARREDEAVRVVHTSQEIEITHDPGTSRTAIVSFSGIKGMTGYVQAEEFRKSLAGTPHNVYYVKDKARHWYNGSFDQIVEILNTDFRRRRIRRVLTLGNSMGGFGAIIFAGRLKGCRAAIAFAPQSSVDPTIVPWERRYRKHTDSVAEWAGLDAKKLFADHVNYAVFFGGDAPNDMRHAKRLAARPRPNVSVYLLAGTGHGVARHLKMQGVLQELVQRLTNEDEARDAVRAALKDLEYRVLISEKPKMPAGEADPAVQSISP
jgi:hypothetical protein